MSKVSSSLVALYTPSAAQVFGGHRGAHARAQGSAVEKPAARRGEENAHDERGVTAAMGCSPNTAPELRGGGRPIFPWATIGSPSRSSSPLRPCHPAPVPSRRPGASDEPRTPLRKQSSRGSSHAARPNLRLIAALEGVVASGEGFDRRETPLKVGHSTRHFQVLRARVGAPRASSERQVGR
jgi:hypothetical protein